MIEHKEREVIAEMRTDSLAGGARPWYALALLCVAQFLGVLNFQVVTIVLPAIQRGLGFSAENLQWVVSAGALAFGGSLLLAGRAADLFGHRRLFMFGLGLFAASSLGCGLASWQSVLIVARVVQGIGTAIMTPAALALLADTFPEGIKRNRALGIWGAVGPLGGVVGTLLGGILTTSLGWPWVFFLNVPIALLALILAPLLLTEHHDQIRDHITPRRLDALGAVTVTAGVVLLVDALTQGMQAGFASPLTMSLFVTAIGLLLAFYLIEKRAAYPLIPLHIFRRRTLTGANLVTLAFAAAANTPIFFFTLYMQQVRGFSPLLTGLAFVPANLAIMGGSSLGTRLTNWIGHKRTMLVGMSLLVIAPLLFSSISVAGNYISTLLPGLLVLGLGLGIIQVATIIAGTEQIGVTERGLASGLLTMSAQIGTAIGLAILVTMADARTHMLSASGQPTSAALVLGFQWAFYAGTCLALIGALFVFLVPSPGKRSP